MMMKCRLWSLRPPKEEERIQAEPGPLKGIMAAPQAARGIPAQALASAYPSR